MRPDEHAEPGRVHELELAEIDDQQLDIGRGAPLQLALQLRAGSEVQLAAYTDHECPVAVLDLHAEVALHGAASLLGSAGRCVARAGLCGCRLSLHRAGRFDP